MIGSVIKRKKNSSNFHLYYDDLCKLHNLMPLRFVKAHVRKNTLDFNADRVKFDEWVPILQALSFDRSLHFIAIRSRHPGKCDLKEYDTREKAQNVTHRPFIYTDFVMMLIVNALQKCLIRTEALTCLELEGLPLTREYILLLNEGILRCHSLQNLSFHRSYIGDEGCKEVCDTVKHLPNIVSLDISSCDITEKGAYYVSLLLKHQQLERYTESWKQNLRNRVANVDVAGGLRRITMNHNAAVGDFGITPIVDCLIDDLWLKALDLQNCGISNVGAQKILHMLEVNTILAIVDIRSNYGVSDEMIQEIVKILAKNNAKNMREAQQYPWISVDPSLEKYGYCHSVRSRQSSESTMQGKCLRRGNLSKYSVIKQNTVLVKRSHSDIHKPWRTAQRMKKREETGIGPGILSAFSRKWDVPSSAAKEKLSSELRLVSQKLHEEVERRIEAEKSIQHLTSELRDMHVYMKTLKAERDSYLKELEEIKNEHKGYVLLEIDTVCAINDTFEKLGEFFKHIKRNNRPTEAPEKLRKEEKSDTESDKSTDLINFHSDHEKGEIQNKSKKRSKSVCSLSNKCKAATNIIEAFIGDNSAKNNAETMIYSGKKYRHFPLNQENPDIFITEFETTELQMNTDEHSTENDTSSLDASEHNTETVSSDISATAKLIFEKMVKTANKRKEIQTMLVSHSNNHKKNSCLLKLPLSTKSEKNCYKKQNGQCYCSITTLCTEPHR